MGFQQRPQVTGSHQRPVSRGGARHQQRPRQLRQLFFEGVGAVLKLIRVGPLKRQLARLDVFEAHTLPVQQVQQPLGTVTLVDPLTTVLIGKIKHVVGQLVDQLVDSLHSTVNNVDTVVAGVLNKVFHVAPEPRQVGGDRGDPHHRTLGGGVTPRLIVRREHP